MGKNKRRQLSGYDSVHNIELSLDSQEEVDFLNWLCEAHQLNIIEDFQYQPRAFVLSDSINYLNVDGKSRCLFRGHIYSPDFTFIFCPGKYKELSKEFKIPFEKLSDKYVTVVVDTKGTFAANDGGRSFSINQKWVYVKHGVYVHKIVPKDFFSKFGVPAASKLTTKTKKPRKIFLGFKDLSEIFKTL